MKNKFKLRYILLSLVSIGLLGWSGYDIWRSLNNQENGPELYNPSAEEIAGAEKRLDIYSEDNNLDSKKTPQEKYQYHFTLASNLAAAARFDEAIGEYQKAAQVEDIVLDDNYYISLGMAFLNSGDDAQALSNYQQALDYVRQNDKLDAETKGISIKSIEQMIEELQ